MLQHHYTEFYYATIVTLLIVKTYHFCNSAFTPSVQGMLSSNRE
jgi:hypothetical protein